MSGQYVDKFDLLIEWEHQCKTKIAMLEIRKAEQGGILHAKDSKLLDFAQKRLKANEIDKKYPRHDG